MIRTDKEYKLTACGKLDSFPCKEQLRPFVFDKFDVPDVVWRAMRSADAPGPEYKDLLKIGAQKDDHIIAGITTKDGVVLADCGQLEYFSILRRKMNNAFHLGQVEKGAQVAWYLLKRSVFLEAQKTQAEAWTKITLPEGRPEDLPPAQVDENAQNSINPS